MLLPNWSRLPSLRRGSGLKRRNLSAERDPDLVSPRFGGGSGLKLFVFWCLGVGGTGLPSLRRGEWIETVQRIAIASCAKTRPF